MLPLPDLLVPLHVNKYVEAEVSWATPDLSRIGNMLEGARHHKMVVTLSPGRFPWRCRFALP